MLGGYRDRVLVELAQNAADAAARAGVPGRLRFSLEGAVLRAANTGAPIDAAGVESASTLRASSKRDHHEAAVGRFGVGFAAVLAVSDEPAIVSSTGAAVWSRARARSDIAAVPALAAELERRGDAVPVLRLPYPGEPSQRPPEGCDTEVVLPLRDPAAVALVRELLAGVDAALLLTLPALESVEVVVDGVSRVLTAQPIADGVVVDGVRWRVQTVSGRLKPELLADRPVEERARTAYTLSWAVPVGASGEPLPLPSSVPAVVHAPTPTDEPLSLPALLVAPVPLDPTRRHVAPGPLRDQLLEVAAGAFAELVRELPVAAEVLELVPVGIAAGALDGELRVRIVQRLRDVAFLPAVDGVRRLRAAEAVVLDDAGLGDDAAAVLADVVPGMLAPELARRRSAALRALGVRRVAPGELIDELATVERPPGWWRRLYAALASARVDPDVLAGLPVPLATGGLARAARGLLLPGTTGDLAVLGLREVHPDAAHPLLLRLGAVEADPRAILTDPKVRSVIENAYDAEDPAALADAVLRLVRAAGLTPGEESWLADLALPADDGEFYPAGELLLPDGALARLVVDDSPFGIVDLELVELWGADVLTAVGVLDSFAVVREADVVEADHDLDVEADYLDVVTAALQPEMSVEPVVLSELVAVRDLEFVRDDAWPAALRLLAAPPLREAVVDPAVVTTSTMRARVPSYTAWWLRTHGIVRGRLAMSDPLLYGLYEVVDVDADEEFLLAAGAIRDVGDAEPDDVLARLADPARNVTREQVKALYTAVVPVRPPDAVRAVRKGELVVVDAADAVVVDAPDLLPLLGNWAVVPVALRDAERVADALDIALAGELARFEVLSVGEERDDHVVHSPLLVADVDGQPCRVSWRFDDGVLHVDKDSYAVGLGRGRSWRDGAWSRRHLETELVRDPDAAAGLLAEADLD